MKFIFITSDPAIAEFAVRGGADWVMVDLEKHGKDARQGHLDTVKSYHSIGDIPSVRKRVPMGRLLVRTDPVHPGLHAQVEKVIRAGADAVMLPFFRQPEEVSEFSAMVDGRAKIILLAETAECVDILPECCGIPGVDRVHIGLNDLSIDTGRRFMFELLTDGTVERMARNLQSLGMPFGIGGLARVGEGLLPAELILALHAQYGSDGAILSRTFHRNAKTVGEIESQMDFANEVTKLREAYSAALRLGKDEHSIIRAEISMRIAEIVQSLPERPSQTTEA